MSKSVHYRLPDQILEDVREYAKSNGVTVTDVIIQGLQSVLYLTVPVKLGKQPYQPMPGPEKVPVSASCEVKKSIDTSDIAIDTIYEPDSVRPVKQAKQSSKAAPVVSAMLSGINKQLTVEHHIGCTCGICKPVIPKA